MSIAKTGRNAFEVLPHQPAQAADLARALAAHVELLAEELESQRITDDAKRELFGRIESARRILEGRTFEDRRSLTPAVRELLDQLTDPTWFEGHQMADAQYVAAGRGHVDEHTNYVTDRFARLFPMLAPKLDRTLVRRFVLARSYTGGRRTKSDPRPDIEKSRRALLKALGLPHVAKDSAKRSARRRRAATSGRNMSSR